MKIEYLFESGKLRNMIGEYITILLYIGISFLLALLIIVVNYFLIVQKSDIEKLSAYECGFNPYEDARGNFDVRFYLVAILFIIFDLEVSFLFPWSTVYNKITILGFWSMYLFLVILTIGFIYEWIKGALDWE